MFVIFLCLFGQLMVNAERIKLGNVVQENTEPSGGAINQNCVGNGALVFRGDTTAAFCVPPPGNVKRCVILILGESEGFVCPQKGYINGFLREGGQRRVICCSVFGASYNDNECGEWLRIRERFPSPFGPGFLITGSTPVPDGMGGNLGFLLRECPYRKTHYQKKLFHNKNIFKK